MEVITSLRQEGVGGGSDSTIAGLADLEGNADQIPYFNGPDTWALTSFTAFARTLVAATTASAARVALGITGTTDQIQYFSALDTLSATAFTAFARTLVAAASASAARVVLGITGTTDQMQYFSALDTLSVTALTAFGRSLIASATSTAARDTLLLGTANLPTFQGIFLPSATSQCIVGGASAITSGVPSIECQATGGATSTRYVWHDAGQAADNRLWDALQTGTTWSLRIINDLQTVATNVMRVTRSGTGVTGLDFSGSAVPITGPSAAPTLTNHLATKDYTDTSVVANRTHGAILWGRVTTWTAADVGGSTQNTGSGGWTATFIGGTAGVRINFTVAMADVDYVVVASCSGATPVAFVHRVAGGTTGVSLGIFASGGGAPVAVDANIPLSFMIFE